MTVTASQRFTQSSPCPVCKGYDRAPRGKGERCYGFLSGDGTFAHCTRAEHAQGLDQHPASGTYAHLLDGNCGCGASHGPGRTPSGQPSAKRSRTIQDIYEYRDADGQLRYEVIRYVDGDGRKGFSQRRPDGAGGLIWNLKGVSRLPYRLPELLQAPDSIIFIPEGEDDTDRVRAEDLVASCNSGGAGKFQPGIVKWFEGRNVVLLADNDDAGRRHVQIAAALYCPSPRPSRSSS